MNEPEPERTWDAELAEWYAARYGDYATNRLGVEAITLTPTDAVLDVGCGTGAALRHAAPRVPDGDLVGVDPVPRMVEIAEEHTKVRHDCTHVRYLVGSAEALPVPGAAFDVVLAFDSFDHWQNPAVGLAEVLRVLKPTGRLVVVKDTGVASMRVFPDAARAAGFEVVRESDHEGEGVTFTLWECRPAATP